MAHDTYRILMVEDDPSQAEMVEEFLHLAGFEHIELAGSLQRLWQCLETGQYDIILLDHQLPDGNGLDALASLSARKYPAPVVMVTGQGDERLAVQALQHGASDYLIKSGDYLVSLPALIRKTISAYRLQRSMQHSLEQLRYQATLLNNVRDAIVVWGMDGRISYWNPAAAALFGWSSEERLRQEAAEVYLEAFQPPVAVPREGETTGQHITRRCATRSRGTLWVSSRVSSLYDAGKRLIGYMDVTHDVTKTIEVEQALRAERNFVSAVLDTVGALVVVLDTQGRIVRFNRACEQITGYPLSEVKGRSAGELLAAQDSQAMQAAFMRSPVGQLPSQSEFTLVTRAGDRRWISWSSTAMTGAGGRVEYVIATGIDITGRKQAEEALRHRLEIEELVAVISASFIDLPPERIDEGIRKALQGIAAFLGSDRAYVALLPEGEPAANITHAWNGPGDLQDASQRPVLDRRSMAWMQEHPWMLERLQRFESVYAPRLEGLPPEAGPEKAQLQPRQARSLVAVPLAYAGSLAGFLGFEWLGQELPWAEEEISLLRTTGEMIANALQRKRMDAQIQAAQTHLTQAARLATLGEMASGVAHQINNPLTTIIADAQLLQRGLPPDHPARESVDAIQQAGWRLQEVVQRLLEFSRPAAASLEPLPVNQTIQRALLLVGAHIEAAGIRLEADMAEGLPDVLGNHRQLEDLWVNLLLLARDACSDSQPHTIQIRSSAGEAQGGVAVTVRDDGLPIPLEQLPSIFEPNYMGATHGRGTGMELSICREIVRQHGGQISVETGPDRDTIFKVLLPANSSVSPSKQA